MLIPNKPITEQNLKLFEVDDDEVKKHAERNRQIAERNMDVNTAPCRKGNFLFIMTVAGFLLLIGFSYIRSQITLYSINTQAKSISDGLAEIEQENSYLKSKLETLVTPAKIEEYAAVNGLVKEQFVPVKYISVKLEKLTEVAAEETEDDIFVELGKDFMDFIDFLRGR